LEKQKSKNIHDLFRELFYEYFAELHRYAFAIIKDDDAAADLVQTVFIGLWKQRRKLLRQNDISRYLYKATYNRSLNYIRDRKTRIEHSTGAAGLANGHTSDMVNGIFARELAEKISRITEKLPLQCRIIFKKSRVENKRYAEIATELNLSVKTVEAQIGKALRIFREELKDYL
jgi:RNA polymerase sigma-70 factor (ECF subfamily)